MLGIFYWYTIIPFQSLKLIRISDVGKRSTDTHTKLNPLEEILQLYHDS